jgi:HPt (histidine-containing phosphotransfer) domain-containing protein
MKLKQIRIATAICLVTCFVGTATAEIAADENPLARALDANEAKAAFEATGAEGPWFEIADGLYEAHTEKGTARIYGTAAIPLYAAELRAEIRRLSTPDGANAESIRAISELLSRIEAHHQLEQKAAQMRAGDPKASQTSTHDRTLAACDLLGSLTGTFQVTPIGQDHYVLTSTATGTTTRTISFVSPYYTAHSYGSYVAAAVGNQWSTNVTNNSSSPVQASQTDGGAWAPGQASTNVIASHWAFGQCTLLDGQTFYPSSIVSWRNDGQGVLNGTPSTLTPY